MGYERNNKQKPIVLVAGISNGRGGTEAVVANTISEVADAVDFEFVASNALDKLDITHGRNINIIPDVKKPIPRMQAMNRLFAERHFDVLWLNCNHLLQADLLREAARVGVPIRIAHAHNSEFLGGRATQVISRINRPSVRANSTIRLACSNEAGRFTFGVDDFSVLPDAVDPSAYAFSAEARITFRKRFGIPEESRLVGTVGRLTEQKNQAFLVRRVGEMVASGSDVWLAVVGDGPLRGELEVLAGSLGIDNRVFLPGSTDNVAAALSAFDVFAFPSAFEGFGMAALEAQFNGLPVVASENVPLSVDVSTGVMHIPLSDQRAWDEALLCSTRECVRLTETAGQYDIRVQRPGLLRLFTEGLL